MQWNKEPVTTFILDGCQEGAMDPTYKQHIIKVDLLVIF